MTAQPVRVRATLTSFLLLTLCCFASQAQQKDPPQSQPGSNTSTTQTQEPPASDAKAADATEKPAGPMTPAEARKAQIQADTERLYKLTQELKEEVAKSNKDTLSVPVIKKADEIEKLAKSLKERMKTAQ